MCVAARRWLCDEESLYLEITAAAKKLFTGAQLG